MADLTSVIRITGTVGGRVLNFSHTYTLEDVYDVAQVSVDQSSGAMSFGLDEEAGKYATMPQIGVDYIFFRNNSPQHFGGIQLQSEVKSASLFCSPGQFGILTANSTGEIYNANDTQPTTLLDPESINIASIPSFNTASMSVFTAFNATT